MNEHQEGNVNSKGDKIIAAVVLTVIMPIIGALSYQRLIKPSYHKEWIECRRNEVACKNKIIKWTFRIQYFSNGYPIGFLDNDYRYKVAIAGPKGESYDLALLFNKFPEIREKDRVEVIGSLGRITSDNVIIINATEVENKGY